MVNCGPADPLPEGILLTGSYQRTIDEKLRFPLPKPLRYHDQTNAPWRLAPGFDGCLAAYPEEVFARLARQLAQASLAERRVRDFQRLFFARAQRVAPDSQWRLRLPADLAQAASLATEAVLVGVHDHVEIWEPGAWERLVAEQQKQYDQLAEYAWNRCRPTAEQITNWGDGARVAGSQTAASPAASPADAPSADAPPAPQRPPQPR